MSIHVPNVIVVGQSLNQRRARMKAKWTCPNNCRYAVTWTKTEGEVTAKCEFCGTKMTWREGEDDNRGIEEDKRKEKEDD